jgi:hypothetical protein
MASVRPTNPEPNDAVTGSGRRGQVGSAAIFKPQPRSVIKKSHEKQVKVMMSILGLELGSTIEQAHAKLDNLSDPAHPPKEEEEAAEKGEGPQHKVLWQLAETDYSFVFVKTDEKERINYIKAFLRPGREIAFETIGEVKKAPVQNDNTIAWDVLRPNHPHIRVVAEGAGRQANTLLMFFVQRPPTPQ